MKGNAASSTVSVGAPFKRLLTTYNEVRLWVLIAVLYLQIVSWPPLRRGRWARRAGRLYPEAFPRRWCSAPPRRPGPGSPGQNPAARGRSRTGSPASLATQEEQRNNQREQRVIYTDNSQERLDKIATGWVINWGEERSKGRAEHPITKTHEGKENGGKMKRKAGQELQFYGQCHCQSVPRIF